MQKIILFERWSYVVPLLCYLALILMIWTLSVPLKPNIKALENNLVDFKPEELFEARMKNSNFNSELAKTAKTDDKSEYLINVNSYENLHKNKAEILEEVFKMADKNKNGKLESKELANWIRLKIIDHITSSVRNNYGLFSIIDNNPKNGVITWEEYHTYFLKKRGFSSKYVENHDEKLHRGLHRSIKEQIMRDKAAWMEAARTNPDALTVDEFLSFTHPESSAANQLALVDELYDKFDRDGDELLTEEEFAILQLDGEEDSSAFLATQNQNGRREEFRKSVDLNGDGKADRRELLHYVAPQSPRHSEHEAEALFAIADSDHDNALTLDEILANPDLFIKSKMVETAQSFHDEF